MDFSGHMGQEYSFSRFHISWGLDLGPPGVNMRTHQKYTERFLLESHGFGVKRQEQKYLVTSTWKGDAEESWFLGYPCTVLFMKVSVEGFCKMEAPRSAM